MQTPWGDSGDSKCKGPGVVFSKKIEGTGRTEKGNRNVDREVAAESCIFFQRRHLTAKSI